MNPWASLLGETPPLGPCSLPVRRHFLCKTNRDVSVPRAKRQRKKAVVNHWPLLNEATAAEVRAAADLAWGRVS